MSYVNDNLDGAEIVEYTTGLGKLSVLLDPITVFVIGMYVLRSPEWGVNWQWVGFFALCWGIGSSLIQLRRISNSEFAITNRRIFLKGSSGTPVVIPFSAVNSIAVDQNSRGRWFDYGTIIVSQVHGETRLFPNISKPLEFKRQILSHVTQSDHPAEQDPVGQIS